METDVRYYRRRACEEMSAASRAVTPAARDRRLYMVDVYLERLRALDAPSPLDEGQLSALRDDRNDRNDRYPRPAFLWTDPGTRSSRR